MLPFIVRYAKVIPIALRESGGFAYNPRLECNTIGETHPIIDSDQDLGFATGSITTLQPADPTRDEATDRY